jgi:hypothetical protein
VDVQTKIISFPAPSTPGKGVTSGWDPYEVWRTRVLLPRLAESGRVAHPAVSPQPELPVPVAKEEPLNAVTVVADSPSGVTDQILMRQLVDVMSWLLAAALARRLQPTPGSTTRHPRQ